MKRHKIDHKLVHMAMVLDNDTGNAILINNTLGEWLKDTESVNKKLLAITLLIQHISGPNHDRHS